MSSPKTRALSFLHQGGPIPHPILAQKTTWTPSRGRFPAWGQVQPGSRTASHLPWGLGARNSQRPFVPTKESLSLFHSPLPSGQKRWQITNQQAMQTQCQRPGLGLRDLLLHPHNPLKPNNENPPPAPATPVQNKSSSLRASVLGHMGRWEKGEWGSPQAAWVQSTGDIFVKMGFSTRVQAHPCLLFLFSPAGFPPPAPRGDLLRGIVSGEL